jgi:hypothetical protein
MAIIRIRQPVEYSFLQWINNYPDSGHWKDKERFLCFVKTVCKYNASRWKNSQYLKTRILEARPHFEADFLDRILDLYASLIQFYKTAECCHIQLTTRRNIKKGHYIELRAKKGVIQERILPDET